MDYELNSWELLVWEALEEELELDTGVIDVDLNDLSDYRRFRDMVIRVSRTIYEKQMKEMGHGER